MKQLEKEALDIFCQMFRSFGMKDMPLRVISTLYLEPEEMTMEQIARKTGYSLASVSNAMKLMENMGTIHRRRKPGSKKIYFYMEKSLVRLNIQKLSALQQFFKPMRHSISNLVDKYNDRAKEPRDRQRLDLIKDYNRQLGEFEKIMAKWKKDLERMER